MLESLLETDTAIRADRSTLEAWMMCPMQGSLRQRGYGHTVGIAAEIGNAVHSAMSEAISDYIVSRGAMTAQELMAEVNNNLICSRPDVQPDAIDRAKAMLWSWSRYIAGLDPDVIFAYDDNGRNLPHPDDPERTRSGQLAWDIQFGGDTMRVTSEVDLMHSTDSPEVLVEIDYKSGWKRWDFPVVMEAFQFCTHAWLTFNTFPSVNFLDVQVWSTAMNRLTPVARFRRDMMERYDARIKTAAGLFYQHGNDANPPAWPAQEKCSICDVIGKCPVADRGMPSISDDKSAADAVLQLVVLEERADKLKKTLTAWIDANGDIETGDVRFGRNAPPSNRKSPSKLY